MPQPASAFEPYVVREGDSLSELAERRGADPGDVWSAPENATLKASRCHMDLLHPLDLVYLPTETPTTFALVTGSTNVFVAAPRQLRAYPVIVLAQSSDRPALSNLLIRARYPWTDPISKFVLNGEELRAEKDFVESNVGAFFRPSGDVSSTLEGTLSFEGRSDYTFTLSVATTVEEQLESIYAQSWNVRALNEAIQTDLAMGGWDSGEIDALAHNLLLTAFYARHAAIEELEKAVAGGSEWEQFTERVMNLPTLSDG
jgi:hypothetical protein